MEFTKVEMRLLNIPLSHEKRSLQVIIIGGILFAVIGISVLFYGNFRVVPAVGAKYCELETSISMIKVQTTREETLKQMLLKSTHQLAKSQKKLAEIHTDKTGFYLLWVAMFLIVSYFIIKMHRSLIRKLNTLAQRGKEETTHGSISSP